MDARGQRTPCGTSVWPLPHRESPSPFWRRPRKASPSTCAMLRPVQPRTLRTGAACPSRGFESIQRRCEIFENATIPRGTIRSCELVASSTREESSPAGDFVFRSSGLYWRAEAHGDGSAPLGPRNAPMPTSEGLQDGFENGINNGEIITMKSTIDAAGRVVIPKAIRAAVRLEPGTRLLFRVTSRRSIGDRARAA